MKEDQPPTTALEYRYTLKKKDEKKQVVNTYELGGGRTIADMIGSCLSAETLLDTCLCICVDLSKPGNCVESALYWLKAAREQLEMVAQGMSEVRKANLLK